MNAAHTKIKMLGIGAGIVSLVALGLWTRQGSLESGFLRKVTSQVHEMPGFEVTDTRNVGEEYTSNLVLENNGSFHFGQGKEAIKQRVNTQFTGQISEILVDHNGQESISYLIISEARLAVKVNDVEAEDFRQQMLADLGKGILIKRSSSGVITEVRAPLDVKDFSRDMMFTIAKSTQYNLPLGKHSTDWKGSEEDGNGKYEAQYNILSHNDTNWTLNRERLLYQKLNAQITGDLGKPSLEGVPTGSVEFVYDRKEGLIKSIKGSETVNFIDENRENIGFNEQIIDWTFVSRRVLAAAEAKELQDLVKAKFSASKTYDELKLESYNNQIRSIHENKLGRDTIDNIMQSFNDAEKLVGDDQQRALTELLLKLRAYVYLHPEAMPLVPDILSRQSPQGEVFQTFVSALINISSPEAQQAMIDTTLKMKDNNYAMQALVPGLGFIKDPMPAVEETLKSLRHDESKEVQNMADLSLGILGSQLAKSIDTEEKQQRMTRLASELVADAEAAKTSDDLRHQLDILGNLGSSTSIPVIEQALAHEEPKVRETAATALRDIDEALSFQLLSKTLQSDKEASVRLSAATAMESYRPRPALLQVEEQALKIDADHTVRIQLLQNISRAKFLDSASVKRILEASSKNDTHEQVRLYATNLLSAFNS